MKWSIRIATVAGIGIYVHATFVFILIWVAMGSLSRGGDTADAIRDIIRSLVRNRAATAKVVHIGYQGTRALYYPSPRGEEALAIAEVVGQGSLVQVGRPVNAWKGRNMTEPPNLFQIAHIATRGLAPETY